jgi:hypothetical protein
MPCAKFHQNLSKDKTSDITSKEMSTKEELKTSGTVTGWMAEIPFPAEAREAALPCPAVSTQPPIQRARGTQLTGA